MKHTYVKIHTLKNYTKQLFPDKLSQANFAKYIDFDNINVAYFHFVELVTNIIDEIAPMREVRVRKNTQKWVDQEVLERIRIRDRLLTKFRSSKTHVDYVNFKKARNHVQNLIKKKKKSFVVGKLNENIGKPKDLWKCLKSLGLSSGNNSPSKICSND